MATTPRQFRLTDETLDDLSWIAEYLAAMTGREASRTDAIRYAARQLRQQLDTTKKKTKKSSDSA